MNLVVVTVAFPFSAGETFLAPEIVELERRGHRVTVVPVRPGRKVVHSDSRRVTTVRCSLLSLSVLRRAMEVAVRNPGRTARAALLLVRSRSLWILLKNLAVFPKGLWLAWFAAREEIDHIHAHFASTSATVALVASTVSGVPWSFTGHRWDIEDMNLLEEKCRSAEFARTIDLRGHDSLARRVGHIDARPIVIHLGVRLPEFTPSTADIEGRPLRIVLGARMVEMKGHKIALEAVSHLKDKSVPVQLGCAGDGKLRGAIERYATALGIDDRVEFYGLLDHDELVSKLQAHTWDIALLPSIETTKDWEGIPVFLIEAMAAGVAVVATTTGGIPELVTKDSGILVPPREPGALARSLEHLARNPDQRRRLAERGATHVREEFSVERTTHALLSAIAVSPTTRANV